MKARYILSGLLLSGIIWTSKCISNLDKEVYCPQYKISSGIASENSLENKIEKMNIGVSEIPSLLTNYQTNEIKRLNENEIYKIIEAYHKELNPPKYLTKKFIRNILQAESDDNILEVSDAGARGIGQLMEETWYEVEKEDYLSNVFNPEKNIRTTMKYWIWMVKACNILYPKWNKLKDKEKIRMLCAAYNGGIGKLKRRKWNIKRMPAETRCYVAKLSREY